MKEGNVTIINPDDYKKGIIGYTPDQAEKFHVPAAKLADVDFRHAIKRKDIEGVILVCGGTASGKTEYVSEYLLDRHMVIYDGTLSSKDGALAKIRNVKRYTDKLPTVHAVFPDDLSRAFLAFLGRDRKFSDDYFYKTHSGCRRTLLWIAQEYPKISIEIFESSYRKKNAQESLYFTQISFNSQQNLIDYLVGIQYTEEEIIQKVAL